MRSRAVSLPRSCCLAALSSPPPSSARGWAVELLENSQCVPSGVGLRPRAGPRPEYPRGDRKDKDFRQLRASRSQRFIISDTRSRHNEPRQFRRARGPS